MKFFSKPIINKIIFSLLALIILFFSSMLMLKSAGITFLSGSKIALLVILIIFLSSSKKAFWFLVIPMSLIYAIYAPIGITFGIPTYGYIASVFATDLSESREFFSQIPLINYCYPFLIIGGILLYRFIIVKFNIRLYRNKTLIIILVIFTMLNQSPFEFFKVVIESSITAKDELLQLNKAKIISEWGKSSLKDSKYNNYILIIGESARKDYHHAYGYPIENTPFMSSTNGILIDGLTSGGINTVTSLRLMLTKPNTSEWEPNFNLNLVDLIKSAGIKTYWVSNQGFIGIWDTPITFIAKGSDYKYFLKYGDYQSNNTSDFLLLKKVEEIISKHKKEKKLIIVHLMGSHPNACDRVDDYKKIVEVKDEKYSYLDCYISSINKTDDFISRLNTYMMDNYKKDNESYSMIYFSDHGLAHRELDGIMLFNNSAISKFHYEIALLKVSSDDTSRHECSSFKSGLNFTNGIASWIGIINNKLNNNYSLFDCKDDPNDFGLKKRIDLIDNKPDPAIDIRGK